MLAGPEGISTSIDRVNGYRRALHEAGLSQKAEGIFWGKYTQKSGYAMAQKMLDDMPEVTAIVAANNFIAIGAMQVFHERKFRVPEDIALVTVDDIPAALTITPFFTVATQSASEMGKQATLLLLNRISGVTDAPCQEMVLPVETIIRTSSGKKLSS